MLYVRVSVGSVIGLLHFPNVTTVIWTTRRCIRPAPGGKRFHRGLGAWGKSGQINKRKRGIYYRRKEKRRKEERRYEKKKKIKGRDIGGEEKKRGDIKYWRERDSGKGRENVSKKNMEKKEKKIEK